MSRITESIQLNLVSSLQLFGRPTETVWQRTCGTEHDLPIVKQLQK